MFNDIVIGAWEGHTTNMYTRVAKSLTQGDAIPMATIHNLGATSCADFQIARAAASIGLQASEPVAIVLRVFSYITPVVAAIGISTLDFESSPILRRIALTVHDNFGTICKIAVAVSSVVIIIFSSPVSGATTLVFMTLEQVQDYVAFPDLLARAIDSAGFICSNTARILVSDWSMKILAAIDIISFVADSIFKYSSRAPSSFANDPLVTIHDADLLENIEIHSYHLGFKKTLPAAPEVNLDILTDIFNGIAWNEGVPPGVAAAPIDSPFAMMQEMVTNDPHWKKSYADQNRNEQIFDYCKVGIEAFVARMKSRLVGKGGQSFEMYTKAQFFVDVIRELPPIEQQRAVLKCAIIERYCPAGYKREIDALYLTHCSDRTEEATLAYEVLNTLDVERQHLLHRFMRYLHKCCQEVYTEQGAQPLDPEDIHNFNLFASVFDDHFHTSIAKEENSDPLAYISIIQKFIFHYIYSPVVSMWRDENRAYYDVPLIHKTIRGAMGSNQIRDSLVQEWFIEEHMRANPSTAAGGVRRQQAERWMQENVYDNLNGGLNDTYLNYFLLKHGVLKATVAR